MALFRFTIDIDADNIEDAKNEFSEVFGYDFDADDQWLEVDITEQKNSN
jgi:hypothetical protein